jgi:hypothetical protein
MSPSTRTDIFSVLDQAIATVKGGTAGSPIAAGSGARLSELDSGMNRVQAMRSYAGDQLKRADRLESDMKDQALTQEGARSRRRYRYDHGAVASGDAEGGLAGRPAVLCTDAEAFAVQLHQLIPAGSVRLDVSSSTCPNLP